MLITFVDLQSSSCSQTVFERSNIISALSVLYSHMMTLVIMRNFTEVFLNNNTPSTILYRIEIGFFD